MPSITIKNIPESTYKKIKQEAKNSHRSLNNQIVHTLENSSFQENFDTDAFLRKVRALRKQFKGKPLTDEEINQAKRQGRP